MREELLKILVCPETHASLSDASNELIAKVNAAIRQRSLKNRAGQTLEKPVDGGLLRADGLVLYPIVDQIPMMLVDEAIPLEQAALDN